MVSDPILKRLETYHPKMIDMSLNRLTRLLNNCGNPHEKLPPIIHIAGTNGKGSTLAILRSIYEQAGLNVHTYSSPHLVRFSERIVISGREIAESKLERLLLECEQTNNGAPITLFEITTAAAFLAFSRQSADLLLLEVGLGGRFDATNVINHPALSIITPISLDHLQYLGNTVEKIAFEKAGILKPGVPAVIGQQTNEAYEVIQKQAAETGSPLTVFGNDWSIRPTNKGMEFKIDRQTINTPRPKLVGSHQINNAGMALAAITLLRRKFPVKKDSIVEGLKKTTWPARLQRLTKGPLLRILPKTIQLWVDGGHNASAALAISETIKEWCAADPSIIVHLVYGALNTREPKDFLHSFRGLVTLVHTISIPGQNNSIPPTSATNAAKDIGLQSKTARNVNHAVKEIVKETNGPAIILICGSLYLAGIILKNHS